MTPDALCYLFFLPLVFGLYSPFPNARQRHSPTSTRGVIKTKGTFQSLQSAVDETAKQQIQDYLEVFDEKNRYSDYDETTEQQIQDYLRALDEKNGNHYRDGIAEQQIHDYMVALQDKNQYDDSYRFSVDATSAAGDEHVVEFMRSQDEASIASEDLSSDSGNNKAQEVFQQIKEMGPAGIISYGIVQIVFQSLSFCVCAVIFYQSTGHWPDFSDPEDAAKFGGGAIAFVNIARLAAPFRLMLALGGASWIKKNVLEDKVQANQDQSVQG